MSLYHYQIDGNTFVQLLFFTFLIVSFCVSFEWQKTIVLHHRVVLRYSSSVVLILSMHN